MHRLLTFILLPLFALPSAVAASSVLVDLESSQIILSDRPRTPENASSMLPLMTVYTTLELLKNGTIENKLFESVKNPWGGPDLTLADLLQGLLMTGDPEAVEAVRQTLKLSEKYVRHGIHFSMQRKYSVYQHRSRYGATGRKSLHTPCNIAYLGSIA